MEKDNSKDNGKENVAANPKANGDDERSLTDDELAKRYLEVRGAIKRMNHRRDAWTRR